MRTFGSIARRKIDDNDMAWPANQESNKRALESGAMAARKERVRGEERSFGAKWVEDRLISSNGFPLLNSRTIIHSLSGEISCQIERTRAYCPKRVNGERTSAIGSSDRKERDSTVSREGADSVLSTTDSGVDAFVANRTISFSLPDSSLRNTSRKQTAWHSKTRSLRIAIKKNRHASSFFQHYLIVSGPRGNVPDCDTIP